MESSSSPWRRLCLRLKSEWFLLALVGSVVVASYLPDLGRTGGVLHGEKVAGIGIAIVFFLHGLGLSVASLLQGMRGWKVHAVVQLTTFAVFPLIWWAVDALAGPHLPRDLALGFCYLCALPSTISSSVALTGLARGNVPAAIFNATLSSLLGIVLTPLIVGFFAQADGRALPFMETVLGILRLLVVPLAAGMLLRPLLHAWHMRHRHITHLLDRWVIVMLVFTAFCDGVAAGLWRDNGVDVLLIAALGAAGLLLVVLALTTWTARRLGMATPDEIATVFCASKKTLASGVPMAKLLFGASPSIGLVLLPIMFYHQIQLIICSMLANRYARRPQAQGGGAGQD